MDNVTLRSLIFWFASPVGFGAAVSWLYSNWEWFRNRASGVKVVMLIASVGVLSGISYLAQTNGRFGALIDGLEPFFAISWPMLVAIPAMWATQRFVNTPRNTNTTVSVTTTTSNTGSQPLVYTRVQPTEVSLGSGAMSTATTVTSTTVSKDSADITPTVNNVPPVEETPNG